MKLSTKIWTLAVGVAIAMAVYPAYQFTTLRSQNYLTEVPAADVIVILGAAVWPGGGPSRVLDDRVRRAAELYHQGIAPQVICTGGVGVNPPAEAEVEKQLLIQAGVPESAIILEATSTSTAEQATLIKAICDRQGFKSIALVTSFYHEKRASILFRRAGVETIHDARARHLQFQDLNFHVGREAAVLTVMNWWQWLAAGILLGLVILGIRAVRARKRRSSISNMSAS